MTDVPVADYWFPKDLAWSPDGKLLAFRADDGFLWVLNIEDDSIVQLPRYPYNNVPFAFTRDSEHILYAVEGGSEFSSGRMWMDIIEVALDSIRETERAIYHIEFSGSYGGDPCFHPPAPMVLWEEMAWHPGGARFLADTPFGILYSSFEGLQFQNGEIVLPSKNAILSVDRMRLLATSGEPDNRIILLDLSSRESISFEPAYKPSLLAWNGDNIAYYASTETISDLYGALVDEDRRLLEGFSGEEGCGHPRIPHNQVFIHQLDLSDGSERIVFQTEAFAVGQIMVPPNGTELFFSTIPNMDEWLNMVVDSRISCLAYSCVRAYFPPSFYRLDLTTGEIELIDTGLYRATINFPAYERMRQQSNG